MCVEDAITNNLNNLRLSHVNENEIQNEQVTT